MIFIQLVYYDLYKKWSGLNIFLNILNMIGFGNPIVTWDIIEAHPDKSWNWYCVSQNPNITWEIVQANPDRPWKWGDMSKNPSITWEILQANPDKDWRLISMNPNITWEIIDAHPEINWTWGLLSGNSMAYSNKRTEEKKRNQDRCLAIKEDLMAAAWHPRRVEKWLEIGGFELLDAL